MEANSRECGRNNGDGGIAYNPETILKLEVPFMFVPHCVRIVYRAGQLFNLNANTKESIFHLLCWCCWIISFLWTKFVCKTDLDSEQKEFVKYCCDINFYYVIVAIQIQIQINIICWIKKPRKCEYPLCSFSSFLFFNPRTFLNVVSVHCSIPFVMPQKGRV